ncbi:hypothetical protein FACS189454_09740 [Planctomycetales bacterium]|nr:hypothetical protein FACS189454_09740 [Planctomycetales bacterium]
MNTKPLYYTVWHLFDQKAAVVALGLVSTGTMVLVWHTAGWLAMLVVFLLLLFPIWYIFVPVKFEINDQGIIRTIFGRRWILSWTDIRGYQVRYNGLLLLSQRDRFFLESFTGFYLPVPPGLMPEVLYRFRMFVGE